MEARLQRMCKSIDTSVDQKIRTQAHSPEKLVSAPTVDVTLGSANRNNMSGHSKLATQSNCHIDVKFAKTVNNLVDGSGFTIIPISRS